ncbi:LysR family transcriptional regulator [Roseibium alexandrii]|nr:LysR family transcriptional regulator [Roseibium alexandrii]
MHTMEKWDDLKFVLAIAKAGNITKAARGLKVTHSTVSRRLASLEAELGTRLFERIPEGFLPTAAGQEALNVAGRVEREMLALDTSITAQDAELEGPLRITAPQLMFQVQLADIMKAFAEKHPRIQMEMIAANEILSLHRREADVAVRVTNRPDEALFGRLATRQKRTYYISRDHARQFGDSLAANPSNAEIGCLVFKWASQSVPKRILARFPNAYVSVMADDMIAAHAAARSGLGMVHMPCFMGDPDPELMRVPGLEPEHYLDIWLLTHPELKNVARIRTFMRFAADTFAKKSHFYAGSS